MAEVITLPDEIVANLERLSYEVNGLKVLHTHALNAGVEQEKVLEIRRAFLEKQSEYRLMQQAVVTAFSGGKKEVRWSIDFAEGVLTFE